MPLPRKNQPIRGPNGGRRPGAGRKPGGLTAMRRVRSLRERFPILPLDHMLTILNKPAPTISPPEMPPPQRIVGRKKEPSDKAFYKLMVEYRSKLKEYHSTLIADAIEKMDAAKAAAPYVHPRLASVDIGKIPKPEQHNVDLTKLSDDELALFTRMVAKAQRVVVIDNADGSEVDPVEYDDTGLNR